MNIKNQKRIAAKLLKVGRKKVKIDPEKLSNIKEAITKSDLRSLIAKKIISVKKTPAQSRSRAKKRKIQKGKGRRKGKGKRKGKQTARLSRKKRWIFHVRSQRKFIKRLKNNKSISIKTYRDLYHKIKSNRFRTIRLIKLYLEENNLFIKNATKKKN